jgi:NAD(P)-dependent dehydrogenase (short-subunit alcohol dehydrogenase family)
MRLDFEEKVVLVTGAVSGIGREAALAFASRGAVAYCAGRGEQNLAETRDRILQGGGRAHAEQADVSDEAQVSALVARIKEESGRLDVALSTTPASPVGLTAWRTIHRQPSTRSCASIGRAFLVHEI